MADRIESRGIPVVFDPVMVATSGSVLADEPTIDAFGRLMKIATVTTPNLPELRALSGMEVLDEISQERAAAHLIEGIGARAILAKGGHWPGFVIGSDGRRESTDQEVFDVLYSWSSEGHVADLVWNHERIDTRHTHGTGCTLSSAIATLLGQGHPLDHAVGEARAFVRAALEAAPGFGAGHGPMGHQAVRRP